MSFLPEDGKVNPREKNSSGIARLLVRPLPDVTVRGRGTLGRPRQRCRPAVPPKGSSSAGGEDARPARPGPARPCPALSCLVVPGPGRPGLHGAGTPGARASPFVPLSRSLEAAGSGSIRPGQPEVRLTSSPGPPPPPGRPQPWAGRRRGSRRDSRSPPGPGGGARRAAGPGPLLPARGHQPAPWCPLWFCSARFHRSRLPINPVSPSLR